MPVIWIEYDNGKVSDSEATTLSEAAQKIVSEVTGIEDVFVYAGSARIKVKVAPVEIFVEISASKAPDPGKLLGEIKSRLKEWKGKSGFKHPINLTVNPMQWKFEIGI